MLLAHDSHHLVSRHAMGQVQRLDFVFVEIPFVTCAILALRHASVDLYQLAIKAFCRTYNNDGGLNT